MNKLIFTAMLILPFISSAQNPLFIKGKNTITGSTIYRDSIVIDTVDWKKHFDPNGTFQKQIRDAKDKGATIDSSFYFMMSNEKRQRILSIDGKGKMVIYGDSLSVIQHLIKTSYKPIK